MSDSKVWFITGTGSGMGTAFAKAALADGKLVVATGRDPDAVARAVGAADALLATRLDVTRPDDAEEAVNAAVERFGRIDVLVNNAGIVDQAKFLDIGMAGWNSVIATNLTGVFLMTQRVARRMRATDGGSVVNIASIDAYGTDGPQASYTVAKAGVIGLTKTAATELAPIKVRVNSVSPGWVHTQMVEEFVSADAMKYLRGNFVRVPMQRLVEINEVARAVAFLAGPDSSAITGIDVPVDCGTLANLFVFETLPK
jgi:meso-butanediol dehydrogenase / (S,S)-butanediol dehydrogenase / diacetyl reductase